MEQKNRTKMNSDGKISVNLGYGGLDFTDKEIEFFLMRLQFKKVKDSKKR